MVQYVNDTLEPYETIERDDIQYTYCYAYSHISRYRGLRQVVHEGTTSDRYVALETANAFSTNSEVSYYTVDSTHENRLDLIAKEKLGAATYAWVISYFNGIEDGFTVLEGTKLAIPNNISELLQDGEILAPVSATLLNLGSE